ncbi:MAG: TetR/AcrR family transcriptional regulator [Microscillaceae bacterium]|nr:TetR/AcrR family transcriptional regulator [Microscillaceae bacterium]
MDTAAKIREAFMHYVLENEQVPKTIFKLAQAAQLKEEEVYEHYDSVEAVENDIWRGIFAETRHRIESEEVYASYSAREKMLAFYYTWIEVLKANRSYARLSAHPEDLLFGTPGYMRSFHESFREFINVLLLEGRETQEIAERPLLIDTYPRIFWRQAMLVLRFWLRDRSRAFEKTDAYIEKAVNFAFDLMGKTALDSAFDFARFAFQNR